MSVFDEVLVTRFGEAHTSEETLGTTYAAQRIPYNVMSVHNQQTNEEPYITDMTNGGGWVTRGIHHHAQAASGNNTGTVLRYNYGTYRDDLMSWIQVRMINGQDVNVSPALRLDSSGAKCYVIELTWNATAWDAQVYRYDSNTTKTAIGAVITAFIPGNGSAAWAMWAIGISAQTNGSQVDIFCYKRIILSPGSGSGQPGSLSNITKVILSTATRSDTSGSRLLSPTQIYTGIKWKYAGAPITANDEKRLVVEWGCFQVFGTGSTQPSTPTLTLAGSNGTEINAVSSVFFDTDSSDTHVKTRWLLYEAVGNSFLPWPIFDSDFQATNLLSYTFHDLAPGKQYAVRVQHLDNEGSGDISPLSAFTTCEVTGQPAGLLTALNFFGRSSSDDFPKNNTIIVIDPALTTVERVWKFINDGILATSAGCVIARYDRPTSWSQPYRRIVFRDPRYISGSTNPLYTTVIGTMVFLKWTAANTKLGIGARCTSADQEGFYVSKTQSGTDSTYAVIKRVLTGTNPNSTNTGDWSNQVVIGPVTVPISTFGINGERVSLLSYDLGGTKNLALFVNGKLLGSVSGTLANLGFDSNHQWSALMMEDGPIDFLIQQIGQFSLTTPSFPIIVVPSTAQTGAGMHNPGPFMDPFDSGTDVGGVPNVWWQNAGKFRFRTGAGAGNALGQGHLIFSGLSLTTPNYSVKSTFYNNCGPVVRFTDPLNNINLVVTNVSGSNYTYTLTFLENGVAIATYTVVIADSNYAANGAEIILQVTTDLGGGSGDPGFALASSKTVQIRAYYNGAAMSFSGVGTTVNRAVTSSSPLLAGKFGVIRHTYNIAASNDIPVCGTIEAYDAIGLNQPVKPSVSETNEQTVKVSFRLTSSAFSDPDPGSVHSATEWEVYKHPDGTLLWKSGTDLTNLTSIIITPGVGTWYLGVGEYAGFDTNTSYKARARHRDASGIWSEWSDYYFFTTSMVAPNNVAIADLPTYPSEPLVSQDFEETIQYNTVISLSESGKEQRKGKWTVPRRLFKLKYDNRIASEIDTIWDFYTTVGFGRLNLFNFVHPITGEIFVCRFLEDGLSRQTIEFQIQTTGLTLVQVPV